jgi:replicative DNA helicase
MSHHPYEQSARKPKVQAIDISGRVPPHNEDAEAAVLSAVMTDSTVTDAVRPVLPTGEPFYSDAHRRIFDAACSLHDASKPIDIQTVAGVLKDRERLQAIGGISYLVKIVDATPSVAHVVAHAEIVREKWLVRRFIETAQMIAAEGYGDYGTTQEWFNNSVERLSDIADDRIERRDAVQIYDVMKATVAAYGTNAMLGIPTGFVDVDRRTGGMRPGDLIIVAGRPGMGKTSYVMDVATNVASIPPVPFEQPLIGVMMFSLEMPKEQLAQRMIASDGRLSLVRFRRNELAATEFDRMVVAADRLSQLPVYIDDTPAISITELRAKVRKQQHIFDKRNPLREGETEATWKQRIGLVIVDYVQLMRGREDADNREQEVSSITTGLKALAKELGVPVVALSQLNRGVETRSTKDKRPQLSDLRESGSIEQDADMVQFVYRPEYYIADKDSLEAKKYKGYAEIIIAKQRNGATGRVPVSFLDEYVRFENRARDAFRDDDE